MLAVVVALATHAAMYGPQAVQVGSATCAELVSSCALVQFGANARTATVATDPGSQNNPSLTRIENAINTGLAADLRQNLGGPFLQDIRFKLVRITLPGPVQEAVTKAQAAFAAVSVTTYAPGNNVVVGP